MITTVKPTFHHTVNQPQAPVGVSFSETFSQRSQESSFQQAASVDPRLRFVEATSPNSQSFIADLASDRVCVSVHLGNPDHPATLSGYGLDPELLEVSLLAALQRTGRNVIDIAQLPGWSADALVPKELISKIRELKDEGLVRHWGVHARTVKQVARAMSFLGLSYVSFSARDLGMDAVPGILSAAKRAKVSVIVSVSPDTPIETITELREQPNVWGVLIEVRTENDLARALGTITELRRNSLEPSAQIHRIA